MRASSLVAQMDADGVERFRVTKPFDFDLEQTALAMHAVVDPELVRRGARGVVGRSRVPIVLRVVARDGWPKGFVPQWDRVAYWKSWLVRNGVFSVMPPTKGDLKPMTTADRVMATELPPEPRGRAYCAAVLNQKGGVGKTALAVGAAGALAERGWRVLLIDLDPQGHLTTEALRMDEVEEGEPNIATLLSAESGDAKSAGIAGLKDLIVNHSTYGAGGRIDLVPTSPEMFLVVSKIYKGRQRRPESTLADLLDALPEGEYDFVLIDCPPALDILTDEALVAANGVLIPVQPARTSVRALTLLLEQVVVLEQELKLTPRHVLGLVFTLYRRPLSGVTKYVAKKLENFRLVETKEEEQEAAPLPVLAHLPLAAAVEEAWLKGQTIVQYQPKGAHAEQLRRVAVTLEHAAGLVGDDALEDLDELPSLGPQEEG